MARQFELPRLFYSCCRKRQYEFSSMTGLADSACRDSWGCGDQDRNQLTDKSKWGCKKYHSEGHQSNLAVAVNAVNVAKTADMNIDGEHEAAYYHGQAGKGNSNYSANRQDYK